MNRRTAIHTLAAGALAGASAATVNPLPVCLFSKHVQWTGISEAARLAASLGFDGVDWTVRKGGHVEPERVEEDLPNAVEATRKAGITTPMITSGIVDASSPQAERVIKTCAALGIRRYRWGGFKYTADRPIPAQLDEFQRRVRDLAALNQRYGVCAMYHTHSGRDQVGASFWDLYWLLKPFSPESVSVNFDIGHATVEGGLGGWLHSARLLLPYTRGIAIKDVRWGKNSKGRWAPDFCALSQGMAHFDEFFSMVRTAGFHGPLQLHFEYDELGGADTGKRELTVTRESVTEIFRRDLIVLHGILGKAGLRS